MSRATAAGTPRSKGPAGPRRRSAESACVAWGAVLHWWAEPAGAVERAKASCWTRPPYDARSPGEATSNSPVRRRRPLARRPAHARGAYGVRRSSGARGDRAPRRPFGAHPAAPPWRARPRLEGPCADVRRELAEGYLEQGETPLAEIAFLLGYSELSAFDRAFRKWDRRDADGVAAAGGGSQDRVRDDGPLRGVTVRKTQRGATEPAALQLAVLRDRDAVPRPRRPWLQRRDRSCAIGRPATQTDSSARAPKR